MCEDCFALYRDTDVYSACRWSTNSWEQFRTRNIEFFEHPNLLCIVKQAVSSLLHSSQTKILCKYFLLGQVLIFTLRSGCFSSIYFNGCMDTLMVDKETQLKAARYIRWNKIFRLVCLRFQTSLLKDQIRTILLLIIFHYITISL